MTENLKEVDDFLDEQLEQGKTSQHTPHGDAHLWLGNEFKHIHSSICVHLCCRGFHYCQQRPHLYRKEREPQKLQNQPLARGRVQSYWLPVPFKLPNHAECACTNGVYDTGPTGDFHPSRVDTAIRQNTSQNI